MARTSRRSPALSRPARAIRGSHPPVAAATCPLNISVAAGTYQGSTTASADPAIERFPIVLDFSGVVLRGAFRMSMDGSQRATGIGDGGGRNARPGRIRREQHGGRERATDRGEQSPDGLSTVNVTVEGFVFQSGRASAQATPYGQGVLALRVRDLTIRGNRFKRVSASHSICAPVTPSSIAIISPAVAREGAARIVLRAPGPTWRSGTACSRARRRELVTPATLLPVPAPVEQYIIPDDGTLEATATVEATLANNDVRDHRGTSVDGAIHLGAVGIGTANVRPRIGATDRQFACAQRVRVGSGGGLHRVRQRAQG